MRFVSFHGIIGVVIKMVLFARKEPLFSINHTRDDAFPSFSMHTHTFAELYCFLGGRGVYHVEGNRYPLSPGDILLMRPAEAHYIEVDPTVPYERLVINFDIGILDQLEPGNKLLRPYFDRKAGTRNHYPADPACTALLKAMTAPDGSRATILANLVLILQLLCRRFGETAAAEAAPNSVEYRMIRYINQNLHRELSIRMLCDRFFLSRAQLCRRFHAVTGTSVGRYIAAKRMFLARELLQQGQKPTDIYAGCGYRDYATFYRAYKAFFGHSPRQAATQPEGEDRLVIE